MYNGDKILSCITVIRTTQCFHRLLLDRHLDHVRSFTSLSGICHYATGDLCRCFSNYFLQVFQIFNFSQLQKSSEIIPTKSRRVMQVHYHQMQNNVPPSDRLIKKYSNAFFFRNAENGYFVEMRQWGILSTIKSRSGTHFRSDVTWQNTSD